MIREQATEERGPDAALGPPSSREIILKELLPYFIAINTRVPDFHYQYLLTLRKLRRVTLR